MWPDAVPVGVMSDPSSDPDREGGRDDDGRDRGSDGRPRDSDGHDPDADAEGRRRDGTLRDPEAGRRRGEPVRQGQKRDRGRRDGDQGRGDPGAREVDGVKAGSRGGERRSAANRDVQMHGIDRANPPTADRGDDRTDAHVSIGSSTMQWLSGVVSAIGLWIAASAVVYDPTAVALWNNVATGGAVALLAGHGFVERVRGGRPDAESAGLTALLGLWAVVAPLLFTYGSPALVSSTMASGVAVAVLSGYSTYENRRTERAETAGQRV